jgi:hypothetical protein
MKTLAPDPGIVLSPVVNPFYNGDKQGQVNRRQFNIIRDKWRDEYEISFPVWRISIGNDDHS